METLIREASAPDTKLKRQRELADTGEPAVVVALLMNPDVHRFVLAGFVQGSLQERLLVAGHPKTGRVFLEIMAGDSEPAVVEAVANNPSTPVRVKRWLNSKKSVV